MKKISSVEMLTTIGQNLHTIRNARKETLQGVASAIGLTHPVISKIENGRYEALTMAMLIKLCNHYDVTLQQVLHLEKSQVFHLTQHNENGSQYKLVGQELSDGYMQSIAQYKSEIEYLRSLLERYVDKKQIR